MNLTCQSEYRTLQSVFIKNVADAFVDQQTISKEWKELNFLSEPVFEGAQNEYHFFEKILRTNNTEIKHFEKNTSVTMDSIYCRDASIATDKGMILCTMGKAGRMNEPAAAEKIYNKMDLPILGRIEAPGSVEGGDVAWLDQHTLAIGRTYRTNAEGIRQLRELLAPSEVKLVEVQLPHYKGPSDVFHLMSIFSPVAKDLAVVYSPLMPIVFRDELISRGYQLVEVPDQEFESMGCNVLAIGPRQCIMVKGNETTKARLLQSGCTVLEYEGHEISYKGGGGPTCLTRPLWRKAE
ncbi:MAG: arginine deiminase family protein [Cyclobacteriaceae bacterium]|nr:arginine deiminase family protein [Cyclobacteriaceae bacterium]